MYAFEISRIPSLIFGAGAIRRLPALAESLGQVALLVTGGASFMATPAWHELQQQLAARGVRCLHFSVTGEPSPALVDQACDRFRADRPAVVIGIGGGSVLDAAKALAGLLPVPNSVMDFLEGVGPELPYPGTALPFIAVPTTAGTGSEATRNAVLSLPGPQGFKKSFRDEQLVPRYALVDPDLLASCPPHLIAANGMDALTQLLESYVSTRAGPVTDALALDGMRHVRRGLLPWFHGEGDLPSHREAMAYAALMSGITLAQVGLGSVHGLAAPLGAYFPIPHGVACGTLVAACSALNIRALRVRDARSPALARYADMGRVLAGLPQMADAAACDALCDVLADWTQELGLPRLGHYGVQATDIPRVVANCRGSSMKTNPVLLTDDELAGVLELRL